MPKKVRLSVTVTALLLMMATFQVMPSRSTANRHLLTSSQIDPTELTLASRNLPTQQFDAF